MSDSTLLVDDQSHVQFARRGKRGVILGLEWSQLAFVAVGALLVVLSTAMGGFPRGLLTGVLMGGPLIGFGWARVMGDPLVVWIRRSFSHVRAAASNQNEYRVSTSAPTRSTLRAESRNAVLAKKQSRKNMFQPAKPVRMMLPGEAAELLCYEMESGTALVYDPVARTMTFAAQIGADAFDLLDDDEQDIRVEAWGQLLVGFASHPGVLRIQTLDRTVVHPSADILEYYDGMSRAAGAGAGINAVGDASYRDLISRAATHTRHDMYLVVVLSVDKLRREVRGLGGGIASLMQMVHTEMDAIDADLPLTGAVVTSWLKPRELASVIREAYDPAAIEELGNRSGDHAGVAVSSAGPMAASKSWDKLRSDTSFHRTYWISEWPRVQVQPGFISKLTFAGDFIHSVSIVAEPLDTNSALKLVEKELEDAGSAARVQKKLGQTRTLQQEQEHKDVERREEELVAGHGEVRFAGFVTISAPTMEELIAAEAKLRHGASLSHIELRVLYGQQHEGFLTGALPLGRGVTK